MSAQEGNFDYMKTGALSIQNDTVEKPGDEMWPGLSTRDSRAVALTLKLLLKAFS